MKGMDSNKGAVQAALIGYFLSWYDTLTPKYKHGPAKKKRKGSMLKGHSLSFTRNSLFIAPIVFHVCFVNRACLFRAKMFESQLESGHNGKLQHRG